MTKKQGKEQFDRQKIKARGFKRFLNSWKFSYDGLVYAYKYEQSVLIHTIATFIAIIVGVILDAKPMEWLFIFITMGMILVIELINTAIEAAVDLTTTEIHPLAKIAKDSGSAATFLVSGIAFVVNLVIFLPKILDLLNI